jgi:uncharacterized protein YkwD
VRQRTLQEFSVPWLLTVTGHGRRIVDLNRSPEPFMRRTAVFALFLVSPLLANCAADNSPLETSSTSMAASVSEAKAAARLISQYRASQGLGGVTVDERLNRAAEYQARAVAATGILNHGEFTSRMASFGISGYRAENLAAGSDSVEDVIARWKASPGHNQNMLLPMVTKVGLARVDSPGQGWGRYWALVLSSR